MPFKETQKQVDGWVTQYRGEQGTEEIEQIKKEIADIKERNVRVEDDKAWETSRFRMFSILILTYVVATLVMDILEIQKPFLNSLIPTIGFFLSVQSLPFLKKIWTKRYLKRKR